MSYRSVGKTSTSWALLLGSAFFMGAAPAAATDSVAIQAMAVVPPALMLAKDWQADLSPHGFLVSEKLDGVRALWDGQALRFRSGRRIAAPDWFLAALPATPLDGELWLGRRNFDRLSAMVRRGVAVDAEWREFRYMIFDLPGDAGPFGERSARVLAVVAAAQQPWLQAVAQARVADRAALKHQLLQTVNAGGEGLMLHRADALWAPGRSEALRKFKPLPDEDARVIAHLPGKGRNQGRMGALLLEMPGGQRFALGTGFSDAQREAPPPVSSFVTYRYRDRTPAGLPRFASFLRLREAE